MQDPPAINIKLDRAQHWIGLGAQASDPVKRIIEKGKAAEPVGAAVATVVDAPPAEESTEESEA
jgi:ribosomal protein S16